MGGRIDRVAQLKVEGQVQGEKRVQEEGARRGCMGGGLKNITCSGFEPLFTHSK
jgi:hypothetical protein